MIGRCWLTSYTQARYHGQKLCSRGGRPNTRTSSPSRPLDRRSGMTPNVLEHHSPEFSMNDFHPSAGQISDKLGLASTGPQMFPNSEEFFRSTVGKSLQQSSRERVSASFRGASGVSPPPAPSLGVVLFVGAFPGGSLKGLCAGSRSRRVARPFVPNVDAQHSDSKVGVPLLFRRSGLLNRASPRWTR